MDAIKAATPKGFKDYLPPEALRRQFVVNKIVTIFQKFGFDPLETPTLEYAATLKGKYGEEEKLIYQFTTPGGDEVALKYDQTVPLARIVAQYGAPGSQILPMPFKRYQIQSAYRGENTQKGRYREFLQCDADIIGISTPLADAEILALAWEIYHNLELETIIKVNDRSLLAGIEPKYLAAIDKLNKIGDEGILKELTIKGLNLEQSQELLNKIRTLKPSDNLKTVITLYQQMGYPASNIIFDPTLIRGLDYYTGIIFEVVLKNNPTSSSLSGGGRWDNMIGKFTGFNLPAIGFSVGIDRTVEAMEESGLLNIPLTKTKILVTIFSPDLINQSITLASKLRVNGINSEVWLDPKSKFDKQLKYADLKKIPYVAILGPNEIETSSVTIKDFINKTQATLPLDEAIRKLSS